MNQPRLSQNTIPLFPLGLVLMPQMPLPLHIFEERYKLMIGECLAENKEFGIVYFNGTDIQSVGCTASIESILKRICLYHGVPLPTGETWHVDLFKRFCAPGDTSLPRLFDDELANALSPYRRFRHLAFHSYGFQLDWERMIEGVEKTEEVYQRFRMRLAGYLQTVGE